MATEAVIQNQSSNFSSISSSAIDDYNKYQRKERSICTYCGYNGHTVEKCYKAKQKIASNKSISNNHHAPANQKSLRTLNPAQYQLLMKMLSTHFSNAKVDDKRDANRDHITDIGLWIPEQQRIVVSQNQHSNQ
ncbi:Hypothetical predicted protein [Olea europaea subsp. europaea]|uniref:Uncharacterized protein n=1 Tax=Olea europaea subsp. europaea TaxID=158383 RepID=A0A8S0PV39_OLEEU|nr:Hypothetical predicted protein [Olea europaea subsp. europaea]